MKTFSHKSARGFTLMESVIAIGVVAVLLTTFLAVFGPASQSIQRALSAQDADRLQTTLERELQIIREGTDNFPNGGAFAKAFDWIENSGEADTAVLLYNYRGDPKDIRPDTSLEAYDREGGQSGREFILQSAVRRRGDADSDLEKDLKQVRGQIFCVRMTQLVFDSDGSLIPGKHGQISNMHDEGEVANDIDDYPGGMIAFTANFYALKSNSLKYIENLDLRDDNGDGHPDVFGKPLFSRNLGVRR